MIAVSSIARTIAYEFFLIVHKVTAALLAFLVIRHLLNVSNSITLFLYIYLGIFSVINVCFLCRIVYRNNIKGVFWPHVDLSPLDVDGALRMQLYVPRHLKVTPGQFVGIWIPRVQLWSTHPFAVAACRNYDGKGMTLEIFVQQRQGITKRLLRTCTRTDSSDAIFPIMSRFALFTGPHGVTINHTNVTTVIVVATGWGLWAAVPYLEDIIRLKPPHTSTSRIYLAYVADNMPCELTEAIVRT